MKLLFATMPFDGHFNPLTGLAVHLRSRGHEVRWYTGPTYGPKLEALGIPHAPFVRARDVNAHNLVELFPEYPELGTGPKAIEFALTQIFFGNLEAHFRDITDLRAEFPFDALVCDGAFYAGRLIAETSGRPVYVIAPGPSLETSRDCPPPFFGLQPARTFLGRLRDRIVRAMVERSTRSGLAMLDDLRRREGFPPYVGSVFDLHRATARRLFQSGVPGFDYPRRDFPPNFEFVGALLPHRKATADDGALPFEDRRRRYDKLVVVSQGTVDNRDPDKLFVPALQALAGGPHLVVVTTGYRHTAMLRERFPAPNVIVEDFIDFGALLRHADLFICNGGYGSIMHALVHGVPILSAGKLEGKNDINARIDYFGVGVDLKTERPSPRRIAAGVARVLRDDRYRRAAARLRDELRSYDPLAIIERRLLEDAAAERSTAVGQEDAEVLSHPEGRHHVGNAILVEVTDLETR